MYVCLLCLYKYIGCCVDSSESIDVEILFQVNLADLKEVAAIIKESMENTCRLTVPLPVKVKVGPAWGSLTEYQF